MLGPLIQASASLLQVLQSTGGPIYPFPLFMAAHAARISIIYRTKVRSNSTGGRLTWGADLAGFLIMCWGGAFMVSLLLGHVPPALISPTPWLAYSSVHILVSLFLHLVPVRVHHPTMDLGLFWLDAGTKSGAIFGAVAACANHTNPVVQQSLVAPVLLGALAPVGGGTLAHMLCVHEQNWGFTAPPWLKPGNGLLSTLDMWTGAIAVLLHGVLTQSHPGYEPWRSTLGLPAKGSFTPFGAKSFVVSFLMIAYGLRAVYAYIPHMGQRPAVSRPAAPPRVNSSSNNNSSKSKSKKAQ